MSSTLLLRLRALLFTAAIALLPCTTRLVAQPITADRIDSLPIGITLPVSIRTSLKGGSTRPGARILAVTTQRIPLEHGAYIPRGAKVLGDVVGSTATTLSMRFITLTTGAQSTPLSATALAIANFTDVQNTYAPAAGGSDRGDADPASWTTTQIGGDQVYRSNWDGPVMSTSSHKVGFADYHGVYALPHAFGPGSSDLPLAVGVFSTNARGLYGFDDSVRLISTETGLTTLTGPPGKVLIRRGDNLLLQVEAPR
jgi:hypothetical protein